MDAAALNMTTKVLGYGRFLFVEVDRAQISSDAIREIDRAASELENAHDVTGHPSEDAMNRGRIQFLRSEASRHRRGDVADEEICGASVLVRLEGNRLEPLVAFERRLQSAIERCGGRVHVRAGVRKDRTYTSHAMTQYSYARALAPAPASQNPIGLFLPQNKTTEWWEMDWMRRETFFLPRYNDDGTIAVRGHTLQSAEGIPHLMRRLYHHPDGYGLGGRYDFLGYFEFAEAGAEVFDSVMRGLRDRVQNPEWSYVREGPEWWGRRAASFEASL